MYGRYPGGANSLETPPQATPPQSVLRAARVMYAGLAASLVGIIIDLTTLSSARSAITKDNPSLTTEQVNATIHLLVGGYIVIGLIGAALWFWMSQACRAGKGWARVLSTVLFGIETLALIFGAIGALGGPARLYAVLVWLIGLTAIILLWRRSSSDYFRAPRY